jgi:hypothetical protein
MSDEPLKPARAPNGRFARKDGSQPAKKLAKPFPPSGGKPPAPKPPGKTTAPTAQQPLVLKPSAVQKPVPVKKPKPKPDLKQTAPNLGQPIIKHDSLSAARLYSASGRNVYWNPDEAVRQSRWNAEAMLRDLSISQPLFERIDSTALKKWHIEPEDPDDPAEEEMANEVKRIIECTPNFLGLRKALLLGTFHGRYATSLTYNWDFYKGRPFLKVSGWEPIHGDKLVFDVDGTLGLRIGYHSSDLDHLLDQIQMTPEGRCLWLDRYQRQFYIVFKHMIRDGAYEDVRTLGSVHGVGVRSDVYYHWLLKNQVLGWALNHWERYGSGFDIWWYVEGDEDSQSAAQQAAQAQSQGYAVLLPRPRNSTEQGCGVEHVEVSGTGLDNMLRVLESYFDGRLRAFIVGQSLSSTTGATGMGSGVADLHAETKDNLVRTDSINLQETLSEQLVARIVTYNRPQYPDWPDCKLKLVIDSEETNVKELLDGAKALHEMGVGVDADHLRDVAGFQPPEDEALDQQPTLSAEISGIIDKVVANPAPAAEPPQAAQFAKARELLWGKYP